MSVIINTLWIGKELGALHAACLRSFIRNGHDVVLHAYGRPVDTPAGVRLFDANKLMKEEEIILHKKTNNLALASDRYRYRILREGLGMYVDCDFYCVRPFTQHDYMFGWHCDDTINSALVNAPHDSQFLKSVLAASENSYFIPPWLRKPKKTFYKLRKAIGLPKHVSDQKWGTIGPSLVTHYVQELDLVKYSSPIDVYYPLHWNNLPLLHERGLSILDLTTPRTLGIHLFNSALKNQTAQKDTPLAEILAL